MRNNVTLLANERGSWQQQLQDSIRSVEALARTLDLPVHALPYSASADRDFPLLVPRAFAARMAPRDPEDPLLRQVLAIPAEDAAVSGFGPDPVGEVDRYAGTPGVLEKYRSRALLVLTGQCAINCRYCFRRHYPYADNSMSSAQRRAEIARLLADPDLRELILSGGDPLLLPDQQLRAIREQIAAQRPEVTLRIHTRLPIVIPDRVTDELLTVLGGHTPRAVVVVHANHPREIDEPTRAALTRLREAGVTVLNQSVLLAGVNDDPQVLAELSDRLFAAGTLPYYLHQLDRVAGAAHFEVPVEEGRRIVGRLAALRPGYLVPRLVVEEAGAPSKREISPVYP